ncbi:unnamed protein product, partial [Musa acuminata subsp. malaccensis]
IFFFLQILFFLFEKKNILHKQNKYKISMISSSSLSLLSYSNEKVFSCA